MLKACVTDDNIMATALIDFASPWKGGAIWPLNLSIWEESVEMSRLCYVVNKLLLPVILPLGL